MVNIAMKTPDVKVLPLTQEIMNGIAYGLVTGKCSLSVSVAPDDKTVVVELLTESGPYPSGAYIFRAEMSTLKNSRVDIHDLVWGKIKNIKEENDGR